MDKIKRSTALRLAKAALEDARCPAPAPHFADGVYIIPDHRIICLCNAVEALISAIGDVDHG